MITKSYYKPLVANFTYHTGGVKMDSEAKIVFVSGPKKDVLPEEIQYFTKQTKLGPISVPYVPQHKVIRYLRENFGAACSLTTTRSELIKIGGDYAWLRSIRFTYYVQLPNGEIKEQHVDAEGVALIDMSRKLDLNRVVHSAHTFALKELFKVLGLGLSIFEQLDSVPSDDVVNDTEEDVLVDFGF